jgi:hypothetical protein
VVEREKGYVNLPKDPLEPMAVLRLLFPYEESERNEIKDLLERIELSDIQACRFINEAYWAVENNHGKYRTPAEFNYHANEVYNRFKKREAVESASTSISGAVFKKAPFVSPAMKSTAAVNWRSHWEDK